MEIPKEVKMSNVMKRLVSKKLTTMTPFMGEEVKITKLSVAQVLEIQATAEKQEATDNGMNLLRLIVRMSVEGAEELTDADFTEYPMDELSDLSAAIMKFSGVSPDAGK